MSAAHELDIVRQNERLTFPSNVHLKFVYWAHTVDNIPNVAPHLEQADAVTFEMVGIAPQEGLESRQAGKRYEKAANHIVQGIATEQEKKYVDWYDELGRRKVEMIKGLPKKPRIFLVDDYAEYTDVEEEIIGKAFGHRLLDGEEYARDFLAYETGYSVVREDLALRQISIAAHRIGKDSKPKQLAILYGAAHRELSVAARALGAKVDRVFVGDYDDDDVARVVAKMMRYNLIPLFDDLESEHRDTILAAIAIDAATVHSRSKSRFMSSASAVLRTVSNLDPETRGRLWSMARDINGYGRRKIYSDKKLIENGGKLRTLRRLPSIFRAVGRSLKMEDEYLAAAKTTTKRQHNDVE